MTLNDLTVKFDQLERTTILSEWEWMLKEQYLPILITASGDAFIQNLIDDSICWLGTAGAELEDIADSYDEFVELLNNKEFVVDYFMVQMVGDLIQSGKSLEAGQIYSLTKPYLLGGSFKLENIEATDISVHFSLTGQIADQVSNLPDGTNVDRVVVSES
ncbi:DUF1851 domain-containing protein [Colwellia sp. BRX10-1]|nr:T6SS immunity protein Tdi1 domain-containing protein [Colwellia sp. BRX10-5]MBA6381363.1 DUF1851 domain-containing protein [Colwellia sp. BRX10-7]MBA6389111.1 DUF1851 domain-containing protein [Colwellia sp. BRX10-2]MBA6403830.1 DUF1851 domain-containing protein [Colwellia sp. BRX10-5]MBA6407708.1 DUF1851 domain-containing protein [Colwellia sp. BRX10-1]